jgi:hypothetical protein
MSWKNIKDHYRIIHIVQVREGEIRIGSAYVSDILAVSFEGKVRWGLLGPSSSADLKRYHAEMTADPAKLLELIQSPDAFERSIPVWTYDDRTGEVLEKQCEALGWPNCTHDGLLMYVNTFFTDPAEAAQKAMQSAWYGLQSGNRRLEENREEREKIERWRGEYEAAFQKLQADFPNVKFESPEGDV